MDIYVTKKDIDTEKGGIDNKAFAMDDKIIIKNGTIPEKLDANDFMKESEVVIADGNDTERTHFTMGISPFSLMTRL